MSFSLKLMERVKTREENARVQTRFTILSDFLEILAVKWREKGI